MMAYVDRGNNEPMGRDSPPQKTLHRRSRRLSDTNAIQNNGLDVAVAEERGDDAVNLRG
jgi:hypothetical protein